MNTKADLDYLLSLKPEDINRTMMIKLFNGKVVRNKMGIVEKIDDPMLDITYKFKLPKKTLINQPNEEDTTVGRYIFNMFCIVPCFGDKIKYINYTVDKKKLDDLFYDISNMVLLDEISTESFGNFYERIVWLNNFLTNFMQGLTVNIIGQNKEVLELKKKVIEENKDLLEKGDFITFNKKVEETLVQKAKEILKDDPGFEVYKVGEKPSFENNYKNSNILVGPIYNPVTGSYDISTNSYMDGVPRELFHSYINSAVIGLYSRGVLTADAGDKTKKLFSAMQSVVLHDDPNFDCGTKLCKTETITKDNYKYLVWRYIIDPDNSKKLLLLTPENIKDYIGMDVKMRTPLFCASEKICHFCAGTLFQKLGIKNVGLTNTKLTNTLLNMMLKKMHDSRVKTIEIDIFKYIEED